VASDGQACRQVPQLAGSASVLTHCGPAPVQAAAPTSQEQAPPEQVPRPHATPQAPQWVGLLERLAQDPGATPQVLSPAGHEQVPVAQVAPVAQRWRQVPQESELACRSKQMPPQDVWPVGQLTGLSAGAQPTLMAAIATARTAARRAEMGMREA
jgi:hypothetical protein